MEQCLQKGQAGVETLQSRPAALNGQLAAACGRVSSSWSVSTLQGLPWHVTLLLSGLSQQQMLRPAAAPHREHDSAVTLSNYISEAQDQMDSLKAAARLSLRNEPCIRLIGLEGRLCMVTI